MTGGGAVILAKILRLENQVRDGCKALAVALNSISLNSLWYSFSARFRSKW